MDILLGTSIVQSLALVAFLLLPTNIGLLSNRLIMLTVICFAKETAYAPRPNQEWER